MGRPNGKIIDANKIKGMIGTTRLYKDKGVKCYANEKMYDEFISYMAKILQEAPLEYEKSNVYNYLRGDKTAPQEVIDIISKELQIPEAAFIVCDYDFQEEAQQKINSFTEMIDKLLRLQVIQEKYIDGISLHPRHISLTYKGKIKEVSDVEKLYKQISKAIDIFESTGQKAGQS